MVTIEWRDPFWVIRINGRAVFESRDERWSRWLVERLTEELTPYWGA